MTGNCQVRFGGRPRGKEPAQAGTSLRGRPYPLLLTLFLVAASVAIKAWGLTRPEGLPESSRALTRGSGILLVVIAALVVFGLHLPSLVDALGDHPIGAAYLDAPTLFWVVKFYDLGIVAPAALVVGIGLLRRQPWARKPAYAILGGYVLLGWSVAGGLEHADQRRPAGVGGRGDRRHRASQRRRGLRLIPLPLTVRRDSHDRPTSRDRAEVDHAVGR